MIRDSLIIFRRQIRMNLRNPAWLIIGLMQPVLYLVLFGPLLKPLAQQLGAANEYAFFVPGLLVQMAIFGALFTGFGLVAEWREGVVEAEKVTPASRTALLVGRLMRDLVMFLAQVIILLALAYVMGMRASGRGVLAAVGIALLVSGALAAASNALALTVKSEDALAPILNSVSLPVLLLSGILLPMTLGPRWLQRVSDVMPFKWIVDAVRLAFRGEFGGSHMLWGSVWAVVLFGLGVLWGTSAFRREER